MNQKQSYTPAHSGERTDGSLWSRWYQDSCIHCTSHTHLPRTEVQAHEHFEWVSIMFLNLQRRTKDTQSDLNSTEKFIKMEATEVKEIGNLLT